MKKFMNPALVGLAALGIAVLSFAGASGAAATGVPLGTAGDFAVLAGSGITNTGATTIIGDSGSSPTPSATGFGSCPAADCVTQTGMHHTAPDPNDSATQSAKVALANAYNVAAGQTPTTIPTELAGQTLAPGVYRSASGTFGMSGTVTLDASNDPNAVFIFQTDSTLITGGTGNVSLIRSTQSCNVFWKVGSSATLGAGSTFRGTIMAHTSISLGAAVTVDGRLLAGAETAGAVTLINDTITVPVCATTTSTPTVPSVTPETPVDTTTVAPAPDATAAASTAASAATVTAARKAAAAKVAAAKAAAKQAAAKKAAAAKAQRLALAKKTAKSPSTSTGSGNANPPVGANPGFTG